MTARSDRRTKAVASLVAGYVLGLVTAAMAMGTIGMFLVGVGSLIARDRGGAGTFVAFGPIPSLLLALAVTGLVLGLGLLGVLVYRRL